LYEISHGTIVAYLATAFSNHLEVAVRRTAMKTFSRSALITVVYTLSAMFALSCAIFAEARSDDRAGLKMSIADSSSAEESNGLKPVSAQYAQVQQHLAQGWNTWDVHSDTTQVLFPEGLAIRIGLMHNSTEGGDTFLADTLIGRLTPGAEQVFPGEHSWDGSYTELAFPGRDIVGVSRVPATETTWFFLQARCLPSQSPLFRLRSLFL
jgi:hypothetical protein